jgi:hypothetical protein
MNHECEVNVGRNATSPEDPRYRPCGKPASIRQGGTWMCVDHYDEWEAHLQRVDVEELL